MKKILITSGGTKVKIDMVRHIANMSSGTFGAKIAAESLNANYNVHFLHAKNSKTPFKIELDFFKETPDVQTLLKTHEYINKLNKANYSESIYEYFEDYHTKLLETINSYQPDIIVLAAAVSDYGVDNYVDGKIRTKSDMVINLTPYPKIISSIKTVAPNAKLIGFKLLVNSSQEELILNAMKSIETNKCDLVVANDLRDIKNNDHRILLVDKHKNLQVFQSIKSDPNYLAKKVVQQYESL